MTDQLTSGKIHKLLAEKHDKDVYVSECKTGASYVKKGQLGILDAWAMKKSWSPRTAIGYEIKVSRSDFLQDDKWPKYLPYCNKLYFVCPYKLIQPEELPKDVGLMWVASTGTRIYTKKKAPRRDVDIPTDLFRYILMNRVQIVSTSFGRVLRGISDREHWEKWLEEEKIDKNFGHYVGERIATRVREEVLKARKDNEDLLERIEAAKEIELMLRKAGFLGEGKNLNKWSAGRIGRLLGDNAPELIARLERLKTTLDGTLEKIKQE